MTANLLSVAPGTLGSSVEEAFDTLVETNHVRIERIVSRGQTSPPVGWYEQDRDEWVVVLAGAGVVAFEDGERLTLGSGDHAVIEAGRRHRVAWTDPVEETVWLAVHYD
ncbi:MAG: cupin domain-containing protein [Halothiobacillaceae bacterium]|nr:cupin domain-containing protein [Halothiobacillaceae bacterium]HER35744.1 cupin domain-containing protein [Halothiobacillaceae bacterium]